MSVDVIQRGRKCPDATLDVVAGASDVVGSLAGGILQIPADVALAGDVGALVAAAHGHDDVGHCANSVVSFCGTRSEMSMLNLAHDLDYDETHVRAGCRAGAVGFVPPGRVTIKECAAHL